MEVVKFGHVITQVSIVPGETTDGVPSVEVPEEPF